ALTFQNHTDCPLTDFGGKTSIFSHPVYLFLRKFSLQDSRGGSALRRNLTTGLTLFWQRTLWIVATASEIA
ncbi:hypothetical protein Q2V38_25435, partial [Escherichia coli]|uniref:hypothetical protein n=1 Tax=Escherichia coli TaxID=562 RepID=UPI0026656E9F